eukprot:snap_masked-scaffold_7-processed-gene-15.10-mRNA-1 protein AED:0.93 eAED:1.00 QI:0/0/0/0.33/1/1/3/0/133
MMKRYLEICMLCAQLDDEVGAQFLGEDERKALGKYFNLGQGKKAVANLLRDVNNNDSLLKYLEDEADILVEFDAFETGVFKEEDKLGAAERTALSRLETDASEEEAKTPPGDSVATEVFSQLRKSKEKSILQM